MKVHFPGHPAIVLRNYSTRSTIALANMVHRNFVTICYIEGAYVTEDGCGIGEYPVLAKIRERLSESI
jgi:predicted TIM-barrel enzyme